jgi:D-arabinose 1-dehydrogenase-like Zn-dependent alcohol dehydrogenase
MKFGVIGLGGLGHMAVKFGLAMGCDTTVISRGTAKKDSVMNHLKANNYIDSTNKEEMQVTLT